MGTFETASGLSGVNILGFTIKDPVRAAMLQQAVSSFVTSGDLREELIPLMWEPVGLHEDVLYAEQRHERQRPDSSLARGSPSACGGIERQRGPRRR